MRIAIEDASRTELVQHCVSQSLEYGQRMNAPQLRALIAASGWEHDYIDVGEPEPAPTPTRTATAAAGTPNDMVTINIIKVAGESDMVFLSHNGRGIRVPRGKPVTIPRKYLNCLNDAVQEVYPEGVEGLGEPELVLTYPYSIVA